MIAPARVAAYEALSAVSAGNADLPTAIAFARDNLRDDRDRALAAEIATGVQRWRAALDHLIVHFSKRSLDRLDFEVVEILRLSAYQMLHLTRVPASAIVDDAVDLTRRAGKQSAGGFVNAVLREISRHRGKLPLPPRPGDPTDRDAALAYLSITLSHPRWLAARWYDRLGFEAAEAWMQFNNAAAPLTLRVNRFKTSAEDLVARLADDGVRLRPARFAADAFIVEEGYPLRSSAFDEGLFVVQDEASQLVALLAASSSGPRVLDTCASPGGKATAIAAAMQGRGLVVACDVRGRRIDLLRKTIATTGATNVRVVQADLLKELPFSQPFDAVIVDAPCSGLGTLRRDPDIRWRRREADVTVLAAAETTMLQHAAAAVAPGGRLVYATCSSEPEENEAVAEVFLAGNRDFTPRDARAIAPAIPAAVVDARGHLRTQPDLHDLEAFFGAVCERRNLYDDRRSMQLKTRVWSAGKIVLLGSALLATYALFAVASMRIALRAREVRVPDLTNRTANEATAIATDLGLALKVDDTRRPDPKIGAGRVLAQEPAAGSIARRQRTVKIWLSAGLRASTVPSLVGETERTATLRLAQDGLTLASLSEIRAEDLPSDVVVAQTPPAKSASGRVSILVNRGERGATYVMPDLIGVNGDRAAEVLRTRGFRVAVVGSNPYPGVAAGVVIRQSPQAGFQIAPGEPISLEVSR